MPTNLTLRRRGCAGAVLVSLTALGLWGCSGAAEPAGEGGSGSPWYRPGREGEVATDGEAARSLLRGPLAPAYRLTEGTDFRVRSEQRDGGGRRYLRLVQLHQGVEVVGAEVVVQSAADGQVEAILGQLRGDLHPAGGYAAAGDEALVRGVAAALGARGALQVLELPTRRVYASAAGEARWAYRALVAYTGSEGRELDEVFLSGDDGRLLGRRPRVHRALHRQLYDLAQRCVRDEMDLPGTKIFDEGGMVPTDAKARNVYNYTGLTYWFYRHFFERFSYDGMDSMLMSSVHAKFFDGASCTPDNAAWVGPPLNQMIYGDGDGILLGDTTAALDVTGHELTHGVTNYTSDLTYKDEPGALNEALSDMLGSTVEAWVAAGGGAMGNPATLQPTADTWKIGEKAVGLLMLGGALRYMNDPAKDGISKDYYPDRYMGMQDNGGVHINSGIGNLAFYLLSQGGGHPRNKTTVRVPALGLGKAARIFFEADTRLFTANTTFEGARYATALAAENLYGRCSDEYRAVHRAWDAVGVPGSWSPCVRPPVGL